ncbi:hypothetical protein Btru_058806 [Bulinus truncatus]|nr:hypothetical protein Btru_058806 [Bulinus truncatus]
MANTPNLFQEMYEMGVLLKIETMSHSEIARQAKIKLKDLLASDGSKSQYILHLEEMYKKKEEVHRFKSTITQLQKENATLKGKIMTCHGTLKGIEEDIGECLKELESPEAQESQ